MEKAAELLIIILSSVLVIFLIVCIIAIVKLVSILKRLQRITQKAEKLANSAQSMASFFENVANPMTVGKLLYNITQSVLHHDKKGKREN